MCRCGWGTRERKKKRDVEVAPPPSSFPLLLQHCCYSQAIYQMTCLAFCPQRRACVSERWKRIREYLSRVNSVLEFNFSTGKLFDGEACHTMIIGLRDENCESVSFTQRHGILIQLLNSYCGMFATARLKLVPPTIFIRTRTTNGHAGANFIRALFVSGELIPEWKHLIDLWDVILPSRNFDPIFTCHT